MAQNPIQHSLRQIRIPHDLRPLGDRLIRRKDKRLCPVAVAYKCKQLLRLGLRDGRIAHLIQDHHLCFPDLIEAKGRFPLPHPLTVHDPHKVAHPFETDRVACVDSRKADSAGEHGLAHPRRTHKDDISVCVNPVHLLEPPNLAFCDAGLDFADIVLFERLDTRRKVCGGVIPRAVPLVTAGCLALQKLRQKLPVCQVVHFRRVQDISQSLGGVL